MQIRVAQQWYYFILCYLHLRLIFSHIKFLELSSTNSTDTFWIFVTQQPHKKADYWHCRTLDKNSATRSGATQHTHHPALWGPDCIWSIPTGGPLIISPLWCHYFYYFPHFSHSDVAFNQTYFDGYLWRSNLISLTSI